MLKKKILKIGKLRIIRRDRLNIVLEELAIRTKKNGEQYEVWMNIGFFGKLSDLVNRLLGDELKIPKGTLKNQIEDLPNKILEAEARITKMIMENFKDEIT